MKKPALLLALSAALAPLAAQDAPRHLSFKGVPLDGATARFAEKMRSAGFAPAKRGGGANLMAGEFAGYEGCTLSITAHENADVVCKVTVTFPSRSDWNSLTNDYNHLKSMLQHKYDDPSEVEEVFEVESRGYPVRTSDERMMELYFGRCKWHSTYSTPLGDIRLSIRKSGGLGGHAVLEYVDKLNTDAARPAAIDDL